MGHIIWLIFDELVKIGFLGSFEMELDDLNESIENSVKEEISQLFESVEGINDVIVSNITIKEMAGKESSTD